MRKTSQALSRFIRERLVAGELNLNTLQPDLILQAVSSLERFLAAATLPQLREEFSQAENSTNFRPNAKAAPHRKRHNLNNVPRHIVWVVPLRIAPAPAHNKPTVIACAPRRAALQMRLSLVEPIGNAISKMEPEESVLMSRKWPP